MFIDVATLPADPLVGTRYRVVRLIGGGSSADVYEATGPGGELCANQVLRHDMRDSQEAAARPRPGVPSGFVNTRSMTSRRLTAARCFAYRHDPLPF